MVWLALIGMESKNKALSFWGQVTRTRVHYGYRRVHVMLRREGFKDNVKRVYRLYREADLSLRLK